MQKLILKNHQSPGDIVMLTAAVRDLHRAFPGRFITDVRTPCPALWENNPLITPIADDDPAARIIQCEYPAIHQSNEVKQHFIHGFMQDLSEKLELEPILQPTAFHGDIYLSDEEKGWASQVEEIVGSEIPFWIVVAGGKYDYTIKWWGAARWQAVVDAVRDRYGVQFVQVGATGEGHYHPALRGGVIDLCGKTDLRQLVRLMYHAGGVLCPVTFLMHLTAAVEVKHPVSQNKPRPCVIVAGGREPPHWEEYPAHEFLHTVGSLPCCKTGGCWRARTQPLGDGDTKDEAQNVCLDVAESGLPQCMDAISVADVTTAVGRYFDED